MFTVKFVLHLSSAGGGALRVLRHAQVVEDEAHIAVELAHFLGATANRLGLDEADGKTAWPGHVLRAVAGADTAAVFVVIPIEDVMAAILDTPVPTVEREETQWYTNTSRLPNSLVHIPMLVCRQSKSPPPASPNITY